jgi:tyrosinase
MPDMEPEPKSGPGYNQKGYAFDSVENIHDNLHGWCGGDVTTINDGIALLGHMSDVTVAAFDPIFWLHHWYTTLSPLLRYTF